MRRRVDHRGTAPARPRSTGSVTASAGAVAVVAVVVGVAGTVTVVIVVIVVVVAVVGGGVARVSRVGVRCRRVVRDELDDRLERSSRRNVPPLRRSVCRLSGKRMPGVKFRCVISRCKLTSTFQLQHRLQLQP